MSDKSQAGHGLECGIDTIAPDGGCVACARRYAADLEAQLEGHRRASIALVAAILAKSGGHIRLTRADMLKGKPTDELYRWTDPASGDVHYEIREGPPSDG